MKIQSLSLNSVEEIPNLNASAAFTVSSAEVFRDQVDVIPLKIVEGYEYMPWGADNEMPYKILELIESDETLSTCQIFNAEVCYGSGLVYDTTEAKRKVQQEVQHFQMDNDIASYFLGVCQDFKHFGFCVSVIILNGELFQVIVRTIIDVEINVAFYAWQSAGVSVLPEFPFPFIFQFAGIVVCNPVRVVVKAVV